MYLRKKPVLLYVHGSAFADMCIRSGTDAVMWGNEENMKRKLTAAVWIILLLVGIGMIFYPYFSNSITEYQQRKAIQKMQDYVAQMETEQCSSELDEAEAYNQTLNHVRISDPFEAEDVQSERYYDVLDFGDGTMAELLIPDIEVDLPVYHGTEDAVLEQGVGHLYQTSLPIGGESTHSVLIGHTGLPGALLLSHLEQLEAGDRFYIRVMNETLTYQVDQILVVEPHDTSALEIVQGEDYVTLVTCTPYGINTHRLLVRGTRVFEEAESRFYEEEMHTAEHMHESLWRAAPIVGGIAVIAAVGFFVFVWRKKKRQDMNEN